ncbi:hypothetical protein [Myroides sp. N17-2]|uniref:hypothetical protein n=1 Tax=Myroides sp. N17-2 TaxID=2030799 RepID=UPI000EFB2274|nr:hypothetical protein [Myroides sp. N17-2]
MDKEELKERFNQFRSKVKSIELTKFWTYCLVLLVYFELFFFEYIVLLKYEKNTMIFLLEINILEYLVMGVFCMVVFFIIILPIIFFILLLIEWLKIKWLASIIITFSLYNVIFVYVIKGLQTYERPDVDLMMMFIPLLVNIPIIWYLFRKVFKRLDKQDNLGYMPFRSTYFKDW